MASAQLKTECAHHDFIHRTILVCSTNSQFLPLECHHSTLWCDVVSPSCSQIRVWWLDEHLCVECAWPIRQMAINHSATKFWCLSVSCPNPTNRKRVLLQNPESLCWIKLCNFRWRINKCSVFSSIIEVLLLAPALYSASQARPISAKREGSGEVRIQAVSHSTIQCGTITLHYFVTWCTTWLFE